MLNIDDWTLTTSLPCRTTFVETGPVDSDYLTSEANKRLTITDQNSEDSSFDTGERTSSHSDIDVLILQNAYGQVMYNSAPVTSFAQTIEQIKWANKPPGFFEFAIERALQLELSTIAHALAQMGSEQYPANENLQHAVRVLAPPKVIDRNRPAKKSLSKSMKWLQQHAHEHPGEWVAVRAGELLGTAASRAELVEKLGERYNEPALLITRIV